MATSSAFWDLSGANAKPSAVRQSGNVSASGAQTVSSSQSSSQVSSVDQRNTPQFALNALEQLISQLSDRPGISAAELDRLAPLPTRDQFMKDVSLGNATNPHYSKRFDRAGFDRAMREATNRRNELIANAPVVQGGTAEQREASALREQEIATNRETRAGFSKEAAFADAGNLTARFTRQLMEQLLPQIQRSVEASGTSGGAVQGLLAQDAASRVAEAQAALGLQTAVQFGQLSNQLSGIIGQQIEQNQPVMQALLQALGIAKGTVQQGVSTSSQNTTSRQSSVENKTQDTDLLQEILSTLNPNSSSSGLSLPSLSNQTNTRGQYSDASVTRRGNSVDSLIQSFSF